MSGGGGSDICLVLFTVRTWLFVFASVVYFLYTWGIGISDLGKKGKGKGDFGQFVQLGFVCIHGLYYVA